RPRPSCQRSKRIPNDLHRSRTAGQPVVFIFSGIDKCLAASDSFGSTLDSFRVPVFVATNFHFLSIFSSLAQNLINLLRDLPRLTHQRGKITSQSILRVNMSSQHTLHSTQFIHASTMRHSTRQRLRRGLLAVLNHPYRGQLLLTCHDGTSFWTICGFMNRESIPQDRKSTRLNSSHVSISYAVFC